MKHHLFLLLSMLFLSAGVKAAPVDELSARKQVEQFLAGRTASARGNAVKGDALTLEIAVDGGYYIFNVANGGFVIVSADDRAPAILGYSDQGTVNTQNMPDNMRAWLQGYADEIKNIPEGAQARSMEKQKRVAKTAVDPLIMTEWDQTPPYNDLCPLFLNGATSVTGCVATAMAQSLYYTAVISSGFPRGTTKAIPSYDFAKNYQGGPLTQPEIEIVENFDWNNMLLSYSSSATDEQRTAVATLMLCCGASVEMNYADLANGGSGASLARIPYAFKTYFGFDNSVQYKNRRLFPTSEWEDLIYNELVNNRPVLYGGESSGGGHAFICDGYDGNGYYHVNWGWSGKYNGYFLLAALNPYGTGSGASSSKDGYSMNQDIVIGIQAPSGDISEETGEEVRMTVEKLNLNVTSEPLILQNNNSIQKIPVTYRYKNYLSNSYDVAIGYGIFDSNDNLKLVSNSFYSDSWLVGNYIGNSGNLVFNINSLSPGLYRIKPLSKEKNTDKWFQCIDADRYYIKAEVTTESITLTTVNPRISLEATDISLNTDGIVGTTQTVSTKITNKAEDYYRDAIYMFVDGKKVSGNGLSVEAGQKAMAYFSFSPTTAGEKNVKITTDEEGTNVIGLGTITISNPGVTPAPERDGAYLELISVEGSDENSHVIDNELNEFIDVYSNVASPTMRIVNRYSESVPGVFIVIAKYSEEEKKYVIPNPYSYFGYYNLEGNTTYEATVYTDMLKDYGKYEVRLYKNGILSDENLLDKHIHIELAKGYEKWTEGGDRMMVKVNSNELTISEDALSVLLDGDVFPTVHPNNNPNTLYILSRGTIPASLQDKNVIIGNTSENITLTDGYGFATPIDFTATKISYKRTITVGTDGTGNGWTSIILPFDVNQVTVGDNSIDWFHSSSDTKKNFWVRKYIDDQTDGVTFDFADEMKANVPYIFAVPGNKWPSWDLTGKEIIFRGENANIKSGAISTVTGNSFKMTGIMKGQNLNDVYTLDDEGTTFRKTTGNVSPFRAYFKSLSLGGAASLRILSYDNQPTSIQIVDNNPSLDSVVYTLDGRKAGNSLDRLPKGLYIVNGKKVIKQ